MIVCDINRLDVLYGSERVCVSDGRIAYLTGSTGVGVAALDRVAERGPLQHGRTDLGFWLQSRIIQHVFMVHGNSTRDMLEKLDSLMQIFSPSTIPLTLQYTRRDGVQRWIDANAIQGLDMPTNDRQGRRVQNVGVSLEAPYPAFRGRTKFVVFYPGGRVEGIGNGEYESVSAGGGTPVPTPVPTPVGASTLGGGPEGSDAGDAVFFFEYNGTWIENPIFYITGPVANLAITNEATDEVLDFTGFYLEPNQQMVINTRYGHKTVVDPVTGLSVLHRMHHPHDLATWHFAHHKELMKFKPPVLNTLRIHGVDTNSQTRVRMVYNERYISL